MFSSLFKKGGTIVFVASLLLLLHPASSEPVFNKVNAHQANGQPCPPITKEGALCPNLCVEDYNQCPTSYNDKSCPPNTQLCIDGSCSQVCANDLINPCLCGYRSPPSQSLSLISCRTFEDIKATYDRNNDVAILDTCYSHFNLTGSYSIWGDWSSQNDVDAYWTGSFCPTQPMAKYTYREPLWIGLFSVFSAQAFIIILWYFYKLYNEFDIKKLRKNTLANSTGDHFSDFKDSSKDKSDVNLSSGNDQKDREKPKDMNKILSEPPSNDTELNIRGYDNSNFGTFCFSTVMFTSIGWFILMTVFVFDYYGVVGAAADLAFNDGALLNKTFIFIWCFAAAWMFTIRTFMHRIRNFFRIENFASKSQYIQIEYKHETINLSNENSSNILRYVQLAEEEFKSFFGLDSQVTTCPILVTQKDNKYFQYQCTRFVLNQETLVFEPFLFTFGDTNEVVRRNITGLSNSEAQFRLELVGFNFIEVFIPSPIVSVASEFTSIFYLYQFLILWLYYYLSYWIIGCIDTAIIIFSALVKVYIRRKSDFDVKRMAEHEDIIEILRDGQWQSLSTKYLVPGDIYKVDSCKVIPCDSVLLGGSAVIDESSLTGEPLPIRKFPISDDNIHFTPMASKTNSLFAGTTVTQTMYVDNVAEGFSDPIALCLTTGTQTDRGQLVQKILFPIPVSFILNEQLRIVFVILAIYSIFCFALGLWFLRASTVAAWYYGMFSVSQLINPLLPAALVIGQSVAASRLRENGVNCIDLSRIMMAGKIQIFCFDKTGTLTRDNLEFFGGLCSESNSLQVNSPNSGDSSDTSIDPKFLPFVEDFNSFSELMQIGSATCHTTTLINDGRLIGNPVDIEMFKASKWNIEKTPNMGALDTITSPDGSRSFDVVKRFEFIHSRASMSIVVRDVNTKTIHVFVKGSFERLENTFKKGTVPSNYINSCNNLAREGGYVLSLGHRIISDSEAEEILDLSRDEIEKDCEFVGLIVFKNLLKEDSALAISKLKEGDIRPVMITGDTVLTGIFIARQVGMISHKNGVLLADLDSNGCVFWTDIDTNKTVSEEFVSSNGICYDRNPISIESEDPSTSGPKRWELAMTGKAFNSFDRSGLLDKYLLNTRVFARMLPNDKVDCVKSLMRYCITGMCGDGGNDCGALRVAHAGLALSDAEASIVSPFSSKSRSIMSCVELSIQGRAAMATSLAAYRFLIQFGQSVTLIKIFTFYFSVGLAQNVWIMVDAFIAVGMAFSVSLLKPTKTLSSRRPTARLLGPNVLSGTIGIVLINLLFLSGGFIWLYSKSWFRCHEFDAKLIDISKWWLLGDNYETEVIAFIGLMQLVTSAFVVNFGFKFRRSWYTNYILISFWVIFLVVLSFMILDDPNWLGCRMRFNCGTPDVLVSLGYARPSFYISPYNSPLGHNVLSKGSRFQIWAISISNVVAIIVWESIVVLGPIREFFRKKYPIKRLKLML
ncbi:putative cation-transporting ATPase 13A4 [Smittium mucronatum]|uniref:Putative cation-transporting ATPase 13A4 n=1 Tax=Smittium mucronatum TaxID=133383 RepID=A0A1R0H1M3_9FUNG|nr:putative cation-transporting ATPase 13A4 [Smittium mucronatum]